MKRYYWRVIGAFLLTGGLGLIAEEFVTTGTLEPGLIQHETYGLILFIIGFILIALGGRGKDKNVRRNGNPTT